MMNTFNTSYFSDLEVTEYRNQMVAETNELTADAKVKSYYERSGEVLQ